MISFQSPLIETFGQTLLHSLWQLSAIAAITAGILFLMRRKSANARYLLSLVALLLMTITPIASFLYMKPAFTPIPFTQHITVGSPEHIESKTIASAPFSITMGSPTWSSETLDAIHPLLPFAVAAYFLGALFFSLRLAIGYLHIRRLPQKSSQVTGEIHDLFLSLCRRLVITRPVQLLASALVEVPTVLGGLRPIILIPVSAITGMPIPHLHDLLAHELAHVRRHDYLINIVQCIIETLLFYHPAVWWLSTRIRQEREHCCDDIAITLSGNRLNYAQALAAMESLRANPTSIPASLILGARTGALLPRIRRILRLPQQKRTRHSTLASVFLTLVTVSSLIYVLGCKGPNPHSNASPVENIDNGERDEGKGPAISFETNVFLLDEATMKRLGTIWSQNSKTSDASSNENQTAPSDTAGMSLLSPTDVNDFLKVMQTTGTASIASPRLTLLDKQNGVITIGQELSYISGYKQTAESPPVPVVSKLETGISVPIRAGISQDQRYIVTDIHFKVTSLISFDHYADTQNHFDIQIPRVDGSERAANVSISISENQTLIIFGHAIRGSLGLSEETKSPSKTTYNAAEAHYPVLLVHPKIRRKEIAPDKSAATLPSTNPAK